MSKVAIFMAQGCEEIEGLAVVDLLRRAKVEVDMLAVGGDTSIKGSHHIRFEADYKIEDADLDEYDGYILPGGLPGTTNLSESELVVNTIKKASAAGKLVAAICAAPSVLGENGILEGRGATVYPGYEDELIGARVEDLPVVVDDNVITSRGMGCAIEFGLELIAYLVSPDTANEIASSIQYQL